jgi:hypothetical protein
MGFVKLYVIGFCRGLPLCLLPLNSFGEIDYFLLRQACSRHQTNIAFGIMRAHFL